MTLAVWIVGGGLVVLVVSIALISWRDTERARNLGEQAWVALLATFVGVFLASSVATCDRKQGTKANLLKVVQVALREAEQNLDTLGTATQSDLQYGHSRLILEHPTAALETLVRMPTFLEYGEAETATELVVLSTELRWTVEEFGGGARKGGGGGRLPADVSKVIERLKRAITLLTKQIQYLERRQ